MANQFISKTAFMKILNSLLAGLAGAVALNVLHEVARHFDSDAPQVQLIGEEALTKSLKSIGIEPPKGNKLYFATLAGDLVSNAFYFSTIGKGKPAWVLFRGLGYGAMAGMGALKLTGPMGLKDAPVTKSNKTKILTVAWYTFGGLITALTLKKLRARA
jgi:hypothetical protein